jgi:hypothetical protein
MKFDIYTHEEGTIVLIKDDDIILISRSMARVLDIVEDMAKNNGESTLLNPKSTKAPEVIKLFNI